MTSRRSRTLRAEIVADADKLERELKRANRALKDAERQMEAFGMTAEQEVGRMGRLTSSVQKNWLAIGVAIAATEGARRAIGGMISAASDLDESVSKVTVVFGESAVAIRAWADDAARSMGLSEQAALETAGTFGNLFTAMGLSQGAAAGLSQDVVELGVDFASFNNIGTAEALDKLRAGLVGEAEPLRALGVNISAASVENKALELGLARTKAELDDSAKVMARWALITEQSTNAAGDFARTSEGLANQTKTFGAQLDDLQADLGSKLIDPMTAGVAAANDLLDALDRIAEVGLTRATIEVTVRGTDELSQRILDGFTDVFTGGVIRSALAPDEDLRMLDAADRARGGRGLPQFDDPVPDLERAAAMAEGAFGFGRSPQRPQSVFLGDDPSIDVGEGNPFLDMVRGRRRDGNASGSGGGSAPTAFSGAALSLIDSRIAGLPNFQFDLSQQAVADFEAAQQGFEDARKSLRRMAAGVGIDLADLDARGLEGSAEFAALQEQLAAVNETLKRIDLVEDLELDPFRDTIDDLAASLREAEEAAIALAAAERDRALQNQDALLRAILNATPGTDTSGAQAELLRQQRIAAGLPVSGSGPFENAGGQTVVLTVNGDLNVATAEGGEIPAVTELLTQ